MNSEVFVSHPVPWRAGYDDAHYIEDADGNDIALVLAANQYDDVEVKTVVSTLVTSVNLAHEAEVYKKAFNLAVGFIASAGTSTHPEVVAYNLLEEARKVVE